MTDETKMANPIFSSVQKMALYETRSRFYLVGSNNTQTKFRVVKIDRTEPKELYISDDKIEYTSKEIRDMLMMIDVGNRSRHSQGVGGLSRTVSAFGIVGFVRFLEGYYLILMTKRRRVAVIGHHTIYKVEDTCMIYIPHDGIRIQHRDEAKYLKMFQNVDLSSNFYFSYSYDLTHTLQYNLTAPDRLLSNRFGSHNDYEVVDECSKTLPVWNNVSKPLKVSNVEVAENFLPNLQKIGQSKFYPKIPKSCTNWSELKTGRSRNSSASVEVYGVTNRGHKRFTWNSYLLSKVEDTLHSDWIMNVIHGFIGQSSIYVYGKSILVTLIARRSNRFAGTRFLKRGVNNKGEVANEVETEQIVHDSSVSSFKAGNYTSYVQLRGSIPSYWSQDISKIVPKPPIMFLLSDPFCYSSGLHFNDLLLRYGSPIIVLNLVKKREKKKHESILSEEYGRCIDYLNTFLPFDRKIEQIDFDMARINKMKDVNVLQKLSEISYRGVKTTGIFHNREAYYSQKMRPSAVYKGMKVTEGQGGSCQTGIIRVNCVDCLDRTNTAQFTISRCALGFQLYAIGVLEKPDLDLDTDCIRMLEELFEDHGDTLALQYGGSQLVHRIKSYRKIAPMSSNTRDIMQTLSRYYSNAFSDADKQDAMNLFLGVFVAKEGRKNIWELVTDHYLHNSLSSSRKICHGHSFTKWYDDRVEVALPQPAIELGTDLKPMEVIKTHSMDMKIDGFFDHYRPYEFSVLADQFELTISSTVRDFMPTNTSDFSPFSVRLNARGKMSNLKRSPSLTGTSSTGSMASSSSSSDEDTDSIHEPLLSSNELSTLDSPSSHFSFRKHFSTMKQTYGVELKRPSRMDTSLYTKYVAIGKHESNLQSSSNCQSINLIQQSVFSLDSLFHVTPPTVSRRNKDIYCEYVHKGTVGRPHVSGSSKSLYQKFATQANRQSGW